MPRLFRAQSSITCQDGICRYQTACVTCDVRIAQERLRKDLIQWLKWLQQHVGFTGWRFDFVKGYAGDAVKVCIAREFMLAVLVMQAECIMLYVPVPVSMLYPVVLMTKDCRGCSHTGQMLRRSFLHLLISDGEACCAGLHRSDRAGHGGGRALAGLQL